MTAGVQFLGVQRASDGDQAFIIPTERMGVMQARRLFRLFCLTYRSAIQNYGIAKLQTARLSGGYVMHYTAFRDGKDRDVCVAVCADEFGETTPFAITRLIEAVSALSLAWSKDPIRLHLALIRRLQLEGPMASSLRGDLPADIQPCGPADIDRSLEESRRVTNIRPTSTTHVMTPQDLAALDSQAASMEEKEEEDPSILPDFDYREVPVVLTRRHSSTASSRGRLTDQDLVGVSGRPEPLDLIPSPAASEGLGRDFSPAQFGQVLMPTQATTSSSLPILSPSQLHALSPGSLQALAPANTPPPSTSWGGDTTPTASPAVGVGGSKPRVSSSLVPSQDEGPSKAAEGSSSSMLDGFNISPSAFAQPPRSNPTSSSTPEGRPPVVPHGIFDDSPFGLDLPPPKPKVSVMVMVVEDLTMGLSGGALRQLSVEGAVHLAMSPARDRLPLVVSVSDKMAQIGSLLANPQYLTAKSEGGAGGDDDDGKSSSQSIYSCSIPQAVLQAQQEGGGVSGGGAATSGYVPLLKYRAADSLRPMPVQVQTKVQLEPGKPGVRVMARISVNPGLPKPLSSVSLLLHVQLPEVQLGDAFLFARPKSAHWNATTRVAEWRLQQMAPGHKEVFEAVIGFADPNLDTTQLSLPPSLPVMFKCQSLDCSFSKIDVRVSSPSAVDVDVVPRVQKRFRVSLRGE